MIKLVLITYKYNDTREYLRWDALYCHKSRNIHRLIYRDISLHNRPEHKYYEHLKNEKIADSKRFPIKQYIAHHDEEESLQLIKHMIANGFDVSICWDFIAEQDSKLAISMIENKSYIGSWGALCANPDAVEFIKKSIGKNIDKINWSQLCLNPHNDVISILRKHPQKICWSNICSNLNKSIINMCGKDKYDWDALCRNPSAFFIIHPILNKSPFSRKLRWDLLIQTHGLYNMYPYFPPMTTVEGSTLIKLKPIGSSAIFRA